MYYDLRVGDRVIERLGLSELRQELTNVLEGQEGDAPPPVVVARSGCLPAKEKAVRKSKRAKSS